MSDINDCNISSTKTTESSVLPTRQKNALRLLLDKPDISPEEIAKIHYRVLERAPGIGQKGLEVIRIWLNSHGCALWNQPTTTARPREEHRKRKLERAIDYLHWHGYEVHRLR